MGREPAPRRTEGRERALSVAKYGEREPGYAWVVVAVLFLGLGVASGTQGSFGLLVKPWETEFGWDRGAISLTAAIGFVVYGRLKPSPVGGPIGSDRAPSSPQAS